MSEETTTDTIGVDLTLTFTTEAPIGQQAGMELWQLGYHFRSVGACRYTLRSRGTAASLEVAVEGLTEAIEQVVATALPDTPAVTVTAVTSRVDGGRRVDHDRHPSGDPRRDLTTALWGSVISHDAHALADDVVTALEQMGYRITLGRREGQG